MEMETFVHTSSPSRKDVHGAGSFYQSVLSLEEWSEAADVINENVLSTK